MPGLCADALLNKYNYMVHNFNVFLSNKYNYICSASLVEGYPDFESKMINTFNFIAHAYRNVKCIHLVYLLMVLVCTKRSCFVLKILHPILTFSGHNWYN